MRFSPTLSLIMASLHLALFAAGGQPNPPSWPSTVTVFDPTMSPATIQAASALAAGNAINANRGYVLMFQPNTIANPTYSGLRIVMEQFGSIMGLGFTSLSTKINDVTAVQSSQDPCIGALNNHWKSAENFSTTPTGIVPNGGTIVGMQWSGSQGCYMRAVNVDGNILFSELINNNSVFYYGAATGMFVADCTFSPILALPKQPHAVWAGAQQQVTFRNVGIGGGSISPWDGGKWNQVLIGCGLPFNFPTAKCGNCPNPAPTETNPVGCLCANSLCCSTSLTCPSPIFDTGLGVNTCLNGCTCDATTTDSCNLVFNTNPCTSTAFTIVDRTPVIAEKPFIFSDGTLFFLAIPEPETNKKGTSLFNGTPFTTVNFTNVYVARPGVDNDGNITEQLNAGNHVILTPGQYVLNNPIRINNPNLVLLGIGFPMLLGPEGQPAIIVNNVDGVRIAGIMVVNNQKRGVPSIQPVYKNEFAINPTIYLQWGTKDAAAANVNSGYLYDFFPLFDPEVAFLNSSFLQDEPINPTSALLEINSSNVVCDNVWLYRNSSSFFDPNIANRDLNTYKEMYNQTGAKIYGNNVTAYGLISDNAFGNQVEWYGNNGSCYSFQGTFPFDQTDNTAFFPGTGIYQYTGYLVNDDTTQFSPAVTNHIAYGVSVYSNFIKSFFPENGITTAAGGGIQFVNASTRFLNGSQGGISNVINGEGFNTDGMNADSFPSVCQRAPGPSYVCNSNGTPTRPSLQQGPRGACP